MAINPFAYIDPWEISTAIDARMRQAEQFDRAMRKADLDFDLAQRAEARAQRKSDLDAAIAQLAIEAQKNRADVFTGALEAAAAGDDESKLFGMVNDPNATLGRRAAAQRMLKPLQDRRAQLAVAQLFDKGDFGELQKIATDPTESAEKRNLATIAKTRMVVNSLKAALAANDPEAIALYAGRLPGNPFGVVQDANGRSFFSRPVKREAIIAYLANSVPQLVAAEATDAMLKEQMRQLQQPVAMNPLDLPQTTAPDPMVQKKMELDALLSRRRKVLEDTATLREEMRKQYEALQKIGASEQEMSDMALRYKSFLDRAEATIAAIDREIERIEQEIASGGNIPAQSPATPTKDMRDQNRAMMGRSAIRRQEQRMNRPEPVDPFSVGTLGQGIMP